MFLRSACSSWLGVSPTYAGCCLKRSCSRSVTRWSSIPIFLKVNIALLFSYYLITNFQEASLDRRLRIEYERSAGNQHMYELRMKLSVSYFRCWRTNRLFLYYKCQIELWNWSWRTSVSFSISEHLRRKRTFEAYARRKYVLDSSKKKKNWFWQFHHNLKRIHRSYLTNG